MSHGHHERQELDQSPPLRPVRHGRTLREQKSKKLNTKTEKVKPWLSTSIIKIQKELDTKRQQNIGVH